MVVGHAFEIERIIFGSEFPVEVGEVIRMRFGHQIELWRVIALCPEIQTENDLYCYEAEPVVEEKPN